MFYWGVKIHHVKVQESKCTNCGAWCQGFTAPNGKLLCADCYYKIWGSRP